MKTIGIVLLICSVLGIVFFDLSTVMGVLLCVIGLALVLVPWILGRRPVGKKMAVWIGFGLGAAGILLCMLCKDPGEMARGKKAIRKIDNLLEEGQGVAALTALEELPDYLYHSDEALAVRYSQAYHLTGNEQDAEYSLNSTDYEERSEAYYISKMSIELRKEQYKAAMDTMKEAAILYPYNEDIQFNAGFLCFMRGEFMSADFYLQRLYDMKVERNDLLFTLGAVKFSLGEYEECEAIFAEALEKKIDDQMRQDILDILASIPYREG